MYEELILGIVHVPSHHILKICLLKSTRNTKDPETEIRKKMGNLAYISNLYSFFHILCLEEFLYTIVFPSILLCLLNVPFVENTTLANSNFIFIYPFLFSYFALLLNFLFL